MFHSLSQQASHSPSPSLFTSQSVREPVSQHISRIVSESVAQSIRNAVSQSYLVIHPVGQSIGLTEYKYTSQSVSRLASQYRISEL